MATEPVAHPEPAPVVHPAPAPSVTMPPAMAAVSEAAGTLAVKLVPVLASIDCTDHRYDFALRLAHALVKAGIVAAS